MLINSPNQLNIEIDIAIKACPGALLNIAILTPLKWWLTININYEELSLTKAKLEATLSFEGENTLITTKKDPLTTCVSLRGLGIG